MDGTPRAAGPPARTVTTTGRLARYRFADAARASEQLIELRLWDEGSGAPTDPVAGDLLDLLAAAGDPDLALRQLARLAEALGPRWSDLHAALGADGALARRLIAVLGASAPLGDHLVAQPGEWTALRDEPDAADAAKLRTGSGDEPSDVPSLRLAYRRRLLRIAADDLTGVDGVETTMSRLSELADATLSAAYRLAGAHVSASGDPPPRLAVIAMGKCGGRELNYVSDVDVIFVAGSDEDLAPATPIAVRLMEICTWVAWPVDAALRPEGGRGPLVRTLASHLAYYRKWARTWEFQALLKARPAAGDLDLGARWLAELQPLIWHAAERPQAVDDIRAMRRRIVDAVPRGELDREIKRGPGGLRDIEFAVQLLQLVHGRADESLRTPSTLEALRALTAGGYVGRQDGDALARAYEFLRTVEHRLQLQRLRRTHTVPADPHGLRWLAHALGYHSDSRRDAVEAFRADWVAHAGEVRRLHAKLLYRPLLAAVARVRTDDLRLTPTAARARLEVLGFADPAGALRHIESLTGGVSRYAAIQRTLLPVLLSEFADVPEPDHGLLAYRQVSEALRGTPWYLRLLRDEGPVALRLARLLGLSRYATDLLARDPEALRLLADDAELVPRARDVLVDGFTAAAARHGDPLAAVSAVRALRRRELFRVSSADVTTSVGGDLAPLGGPPLDVLRVGQALADIADATLAAALHAAVGAQRPDGAGGGGSDGGVRFAVIGMGRLGGREMSYPSDADVLFVYQPPPGMPEDEASGVAHRIAEQVRHLLAAPAPDPPLQVDADLRPEGRQGPLVRSLAAYRQYYDRWSKVWEAQALLRARFVAGDADVGARFLEVADRVRYPRSGLDRAQVTEILRIKARVDSERLPRGADPLTHTKLGRGGLADVEWAVQLLQLRHGHQVPALRTTSTPDALAAARDAALIAPDDAAELDAAWRLASRVRNALTLVRGRAMDQLPRQGPVLAGVALLLGADDPGEFVDNYLRTARRARHAVERVFGG
ncbi:MAG TPA: bifunctional [glutamine synthetase] adenylyltransferase/[glutamine synthetase]-adenylyl-L-tyrosine phosphorylase [Micromonosporaceae bacterium]